MMMPWGSVFAINNLGVTPKQLPILFMVAGVSSLIVMPFIGKLSDRIEKFKIFAIASVWMIMMVLIYTNLANIPFWFVLIMNILFMTGILSRMVPAMALTSALPEMHDRGAFMSINSSLQQIAGGIAAAVGGMIVVQQTKTSPLEHYNTLGLIMVVISVLSVFMVYRISKIVKAQQKQKMK